MCIYEDKMRLLKAFTIYLISQIILFTLYFFVFSKSINYQDKLLESLVVTLPLSVFIPIVFLIFDKFIFSEEI